MGWREFEALLLKTAYRIAEELDGLREVELPALALKTLAEALIFIFLLYTVAEVAASLWRMSEGLLHPFP